MENSQEAVESTEDFEATFGDRQGHRVPGFRKKYGNILLAANWVSTWPLWPMMSLILSILVLFKIQNPERDHSIGHS